MQRQSHLVFQAFYPSPWVGGHCIPVDPFYLIWKAREYDFSTRFIELAGEINTSMPYYVAGKIADALNYKGVAIKGSKVLVLGAAYKKDVDNMRESPAVHVIELLQGRGAKVDYHDPYVPKLPKLRGHTLNMTSIRLDKKAIKKYDCAVIITDHSCSDYKWLAKESRLLVDSRGSVKGINGKNIVQA